MLVDLGRDVLRTRGRALHTLAQHGNLAAQRELGGLVLHPRARQLLPHVSQRSFQLSHVLRVLVNELRSFLRRLSRLLARLLLGGSQRLLAGLPCLLGGSQRQTARSRRGCSAGRAGRGCLGFPVAKRAVAEPLPRNTAGEPPDESPVQRAGASSLLGRLRRLRALASALRVAAAHPGGYVRPRLARVADVSLHGDLSGDGAAGADALGDHRAGARRRQRIRAAWAEPVRRRRVQSDRVARPVAVALLLHQRRAVRTEQRHGVQIQRWRISSARRRRRCCFTRAANAPGSWQGRADHGVGGHRELDPVRRRAIWPHELWHAARAREVVASLGAPWAGEGGVAGG